MMAWLARLAASEALVARNCRHRSKPSAARWVTMTCGSYVWPSGTGFSSVRQSWQTAQASIPATTSPKARHRASVSAPSASSVQARAWADSVRNNAVPPNHDRCRDQGTPRYRTGPGCPSTRGTAGSIQTQSGADLVQIVPTGGNASG